MRTDNYVINSLHNNKEISLDFSYKIDGKKKPVLLFIHGFKGFKDWGTFNLISEHFADHGFVFVKLNLSHNGTNPDNPVDFVDLEAFGNNNFSIELDDIGRVIDFVLSEDGPLPDEQANKSGITLIGHSRGGGLAILKAGEDSRVNRLITLAAINDLKQRWPKEVIDKWEKDGVMYITNSRTGQEMPLYYQLVEDVRNNPERLDIPLTAKRLNIPWLIVHGTDDETLHFSMAKELSAWNSGARLFLIEGANHTFGGSHPYHKSEIPADTMLWINESFKFLKQN